MNVKHYLLLVVSSCVYVACEKPGQAFESKSAGESNAVVLIFQKMPDISDTCAFVKDAGYFSKTFEPEVLCYDDFRNKALAVDKSEQYDTITFSTVANHMIVRHRYDAFNYYEYLFNRGDTVIFTYNQGRPFPHITNRSTMAYDLTFDHVVRSKFIYRRHAPIFRYASASSFIDYGKPDLKAQEIAIKNQAFQDAGKFSKSEANFLDSLHVNKLISDDVFEFYKNRNVNAMLTLNVKENTWAYSDVERVISIDSTKSDVFPNMYYNLLLEAVADKYLVETAPRIDFKDGVNRDYRAVYRLVDSSAMFTPGSRQVLLTREINRIANSFSRDDFREYFGYFEKDVRDTTMINFIKNENFLSFNQDEPMSNTLALVSQQRTKLTLDDIISANKGKVVFVDFWASWCAPCRAAMPASLKLRGELSDHVVFVYLSIDKNFGAWERASVKDGLSDIGENYIALDHESSDFTKKYAIGSIPRYMLFDKKGNLAYANAMGPESADLKGLLQKLAVQ